MLENLFRKSLVTLFTGAALLGCSADTSGLNTLDLPQLIALLAADETALLCDANTADTRAEYGVIPGAILLSNYRDYDVAGELPADLSRKLIFYCHSPMCGAGADAARVAVAAGHRDVAVYPAGIKGWVDGDQPIEPVEASRKEAS